MSVPIGTIGSLLPIAVGAVRSTAQLLSGGSDAFSRFVSEGANLHQAPAHSLQELLSSLNDQLRKIAGENSFELTVQLDDGNGKLSVTGPAAESIGGKLRSDGEFKSNLIDISRQAISEYSSHIGANSITFRNSGWSLNSGKI